MFKKERDLTERSKSLLKNKEVRVLKADVSSTFNISEDDLNQLLPAKGSVSISKLCSKILIYSVNSVPLFFSIKNDILPTLYSLWKYPEMARCILIPGPVSQFIMNGADLMLPGVAAISNLEGLKKGDVVCIKIIGNPLPLAVGYSDIDGDQITSSGNKGKCVVVVHCFGDMLWQSGGAISPNKGFSTNCRHISPIQSYDMDDTMENLDIHPDGNDSLSQLKNDVIDEASHEGTIKESVNIIESDVRHVIEDSVGFTSESISNIDIIDIVVSTSNTISDCGDATATQDEIMKAEDAHHDVDVQSFNQTVDAIAIQRSSADSLLLVCLLRCLKYGVRDKDLPILASKFWSILLRCSPETHTQPDIKESSYKQVKTFLRHAQLLGLIEVEDALQDGVYNVVHIQRSHDLYKEHISFLSITHADEFKKYITNFGGESTTQTNSHNSIAGEGKYKVLEVFKISKALKEIFQACRVEYETIDDGLVGPQIKQVVMNIVKDLRIEDPINRLNVQLPSSPPPHSFPSIDESNSAQSDACMRDTICYQIYNLISDQLSVNMKETQIQNTSPTVVMVDSTTLESSSSASLNNMCGNRSNANISISSQEDFPSISSGLDLASKTSAVGSKVKSMSSNVSMQYVTVSKDTLIKMIRDKLSKSYYIVSPAGDLVRCSNASKPPCVELDLEMRSGRKMVTKIKGLELFGVDVNGVTKEFQKKFACSSSVGLVPGYAKLQEVVMQGSWLHELEEFLVDKCHMSRSIIVVSNKTAKKKK